MAEVEKVHFLTEAIYKNLLDNFSPGVKQLISSGRTFQKSLHAVVTSSKAYIDCIYGLARSAQICKGATSEVGTALLQMAEVHKEINTQMLDNIKTFHSELLIPLETSHENEQKQMQALHKKYIAGHKIHLAPYEKAQVALKKQKKKNKNKFGFDQKELQYTREVKECVIKLEEYHSNQLREALKTEREKYCSLMERICTVVRNYASHHSKAHELLTHRLSEWSDLCRNPHILPESSELVVQAFRNAHQDHMYSTTDEMQDMRRRASLEYARQGSNSGSNPGSNQDSDSITYGISHRITSHDTAYQNSVVANGMMTQDDYAVAGLQRSITFHDSSGPHGRHKVRALHSHQENGDNQLAFNEGDVLSLLGEQRDGWQYGECMRNHRMGWFPISFTQPLQTGSADAHVSIIPTLSLSGRVKSLGNLREVTDEDYNLQHSTQALNSGYSDSDSGHGVDISSNKRPSSSYQQSNNNRKNKFGGNDEKLNVNASHQPRDAPSPPLPPPPPPAIQTQSHPDSSNIHHSGDHSQRMPPLPPPPFNNQHVQNIVPHHQQQHYHPNINRLIHSSNSFLMNSTDMEAPTPMYEYHPRNSSNNTIADSNRSPHNTGKFKRNDFGNPTQQNQLVNSYSPGKSSSGYSSNGSYFTPVNYQHKVPTDKFPPPPPNLPPPPPASEDDEERNNPFANVDMKRTKVYNRSAQWMK